MISLFWENVSIRLDKMGKSQKWLSDTSNVGKTVINSGISRKSSPSADNAYAIAKVFEISIEELLEGEAGIEYVRRIIKNDPRAVQVPDHIFPVVEGLLLLDDRDLSVVLAQVNEMTKEKKGKSKPKTDTEVITAAG
jgi:transcriptional regulator with XRE-family HTH domain